jgi:small-conductance mechanosensitive channel
MELYKSRDFSGLFQDTFVFIKQNGKHFFREYFIVNGIFLLVLAVLGYFFTKFYTDFIFGGILNNKSTTMLDDYLNDNFGLFIALLALFLIIAIIAGVVSYVFPFIYLKLYAENAGKNFETRDILNSYKTNIGKLVVYILCCILISVPMLLLFSICGFLLAITIVGIMALPLLLGAFMLYYSMTLMEYIQGEKGIWSCFGYSWDLLKSKFWPAVGSVGLFYLIVYIIQNIISIIPYFFGMARMFTTVQDGSSNAEELGATMTVVMLVVFFLTFFVSAILNNVVQLNQGIIFYTLKEEKENINTKSVIDQIGSGE